MALSFVWLFFYRFLLVRFLSHGFPHTHTNTHAPPYIPTESIGWCLCPVRRGAGLSVAARTAQGKRAGPCLYMSMASSSEVFWYCPSMLYHRLERSITER
jgi:hypothetical protein